MRLTLVADVPAPKQVAQVDGSVDTTMAKMAACTAACRSTRTCAKCHERSSIEFARVQARRRLVEQMLNVCAAERLHPPV